MYGVFVACAKRQKSYAAYDPAMLNLRLESRLQIHVCYAALLEKTRTVRQYGLSSGSP